MKSIYLSNQIFKSLLILIGVFSLLSVDSFAQNGCIDFNACNYDNTAIFDDGSCTYVGYFIPGPGVVGPAIRSCSVPEGYIFPNQVCVLNIIIDDDYCLITEWDNLCQTAYEECLGCAPTVFIPAIGVTGPAVIGCYPPEGYIYPDQDCATSVIANDPFCLNTTWDFLCNDAYTSCAGCSPVVWIPNVAAGAPVIVSCFQPEGYGPTIQENIAITLAEIPSCSSNWDAGCAGYYSSLNEFCDPSIYVPEVLNTGPAVLSCGETPDGYEQVPAYECAYSAFINSSFCLTGAWDAFCEEDYNSCAYGCPDPGCDNPLACNYDPLANCVAPTLCKFESWYIPIELGVSLPIIACEAPAGYVQASSNCMAALQFLDPFCFNTNWDAICQYEYEACITGNLFQGCTYSNATNYDIDAVIEDGSCEFAPSSCPGDLNGDLVINTGDLNSFLALFGTSCI